MKKLMMMALVAGITSTAFAQEDALKSILKAKSYDEAKTLLNNSKSSFNAEQTAKAYNKLVDLSVEKINKEQQTITANQMAEQMKTGKVEAYDTLGFYTAVYNALDNAILADNFDVQPNEKGKVKPKFHKTNQDRLYGFRPYLISAGQDAMKQQNNKRAYSNFKMYVESATAPLFADVDKTKNPDQYLGEIARVSAFYAFQDKDFDAATKYVDIAMADPEARKDALGIKLYLMQQGLKTREDSLGYVAKLKDLYATEKENEQVFGNLAQMYGYLGMKAEQNEMINEKLRANPNDFMALSLRAKEAMDEGKDDEAITYFKKALETKKDDSLVLTYLGFSLNRKAANLNGNKAEQTKLYNESAHFLEIARDVDPTCERANWKYPLYQCYYSLYGEKDSRTKELEALVK